MHYCSLDLETTSLNPWIGQILEIGAIIDDLQDSRPLDTLPTYHKYLLEEDNRIKGEIFALSMNTDTILAMRDAIGTDMVISPKELAESFGKWLDENNIEKVVFAGKNFGMFDSKFLDMIYDWKDINASHRALDVGSMYVTKDDKDVPNLSTCLERAGLPSVVTHHAVEDAMQVVRLIRHKLL